MSIRWPVFICGLLLCATTAAASTETTPKILRVYGPGGPHHVLAECADLFRDRHGVEVAVVKALPHELDRRVREDGDIYYGGAECMLEEFDLRNPGVLDLATIEKLHPRRLGIIVRKGNPLSIRGIDDLRQKGVEILDVKLENMGHFHDLFDYGDNVRRFVYTGKQGTAAWLDTPSIDAWITYKSWHFRLLSESDFIEIPGATGLRFLPLVLTHRTPHREAAMQFIAFLQSSEARQIFLQHGWQ